MVFKAFEGFELAFRSMSLRVAAEIHASSIFSLDATTEFNSNAFTLDAIAFANSRRVRLDSGYEYEIREGTGLRIALLVTDLKAEVAGSFAAVAAQAELGLANVTYRLDGIGVAIETITKLMDLELQDEFTSATLPKMRSGINQFAKDLKKLADNASPPLAEYSVPILEAPDNPKDRAMTVNYAMSQISHRLPLKLALSQAPKEIDSGGVRFAYAQVTGVADPTTEEWLDEKYAEKATQWFRQGRLHD